MIPPSGFAAPDAAHHSDTQQRGDHDENTQNLSRPPAAGEQRGGIGAVIGGRYTLVDRIGSGGMGTVWRAYDGLLRRDVAIKEVILPPGMAPNERDDLTARTLREARAAAGLSHPSVIRVYDVVTDHGRPWIVMELLDARSLADVLETEGTLSPRAAAKIGLAILGALEAAHAAGVLHRDVKPGNVLICSDGRCILTDFGVARSRSDSEITSPGLVLGSPHYISPERAVGKEFGPPSDLFSLGVTLYTAVEGRPPFDRGDALATMQAVVNDPPERPQNAGELAPVLLGLLQKDPAQRWDVERTREALRAILLKSQPQQRREEATAPLPATPPPVAPTSAPPQASATPPGFGVPSAPSQTPKATALYPTQAPFPSSPAPAPSAPTPTPGVSRGVVTLPPAGQPTGYPPAAESYGYEDQGYAAGNVVTSASPGRFRGPWLLGAAAVVVVLLLLVVFSGNWFGGGGEEEPEAQPSPSSVVSEAPLETRIFSERGMSVAIPVDWEERRGENTTWVNFHNPDNDQAWLRINIEPSGTTPRDLLEGAERRFEEGCCSLTDYERVELRDATMAGREAAELEYTATSTQTNQPRHAIWRVIVVDGTAFQVYLSVPEELFVDSLPVFQAAVDSFQLT